jgi:hypothetical protein
MGGRRASLATSHAGAERGKHSIAVKSLLAYSDVSFA